MMADLIRTSMFCDVNDIYAEEELQLLSTKHTCYDVINQDDNFLEFAARDSDFTEEVATDQNSSPHPPARQESSHQTTHLSDNLTTTAYGNTSLQCCQGTVTAEICEDFLTRIVQASMVDFSTFVSVSSDKIFGNDYLKSIELKKETNILAEKQEKGVLKDKSNSFTQSRPPYSYAACAVTAIYLSGKDCLSLDEIMDQLYNMFDELKNDNRAILRKRFSNVLRQHTLFKRKDDLSFHVVPGRVNRNTFYRQMLSGQNRRSEYAKMIHHHFNVPSMLKDLGIDIGVAEKRQRRKKRKNAVRDLLKYRRSSVSVEAHSQSEKPLTSTSSTLKMPQRPCFHDSRDNEDDELLTQNTCQNVSPVCLDGSQKSSDVCSDVTMGLCSVDTDPGTYQHSSVVVPVPRYAAPTPSAYIPLRSQEYHIPFIGTFHLVDMYYNGQIIHQLFA